jgi:hypothetical protein
MAGTDQVRGISPAELASQLQNTTIKTASVSDAGTATGGTATSLIDTTKDWEVNLLAGDIIKVTHAGIDYERTITSNTANTLNFATLGVTVVAGDSYQVISNPKAPSNFDYWSSLQQLVQIPAVAADVALPDIVVTGLPSTATINRAEVIFAFGGKENTNAAANALTNQQSIQIRINTPGPWTNAITFPAGFFALPLTSGLLGGDAPIGSIDVSSVVVGNGTYNLQWHNALANFASIDFTDCQVGLRIWYK